MPEPEDVGEAWYLLESAGIDEPDRSHDPSKSEGITNSEDTDKAEVPGSVSSTKSAICPGVLEN